MSILKDIGLVIVVIIIVVIAVQLKVSSKPVKNAAGKTARGGLWVLFWPVGLAASLHHGKQKRHKELMEKLDELKK